MGKIENTEIEVLDADGVVIEDEGIVTFNKPYNFEGKEYTEINLSGIDDLKASDMIAANKVMDRNGSTSFIPEVSLHYALIMASKATKLPIEFFNGLSPKEAMKVKNKVIGFLFGQE